MFTFKSRERFKFTCLVCGKSWSKIADLNDDIYKGRIILLFAGFYRLNITLKFCHNVQNCNSKGNIRLNFGHKTYSKNSANTHHKNSHLGNDKLL